MEQPEINLEDIKKSIDELNEKVSSLQETNKQITDVAHTNYGLMQTIFMQNDQNLKTIENKNSKSLKIVYACIAVVLMIIAYMLKIHFIG